ncbi:MAG TPA: OmpW family outer membrane protein [Syntrophales bacterium]|mgnify:FL=1|nr:OmpW family outer membrane protein [Syntrophales bacterium]HNS54882.1 OmpW family outer membrane protein [Syntrophales bacterium]
MRKFLACLSVLVLSGMLLFTAVPAATAKEAGPFYVGLYGGWVMPQDLEPEDGDDVPLKDSWALGAKFGYIIPQVKWLAVELDYAYLAEQDIDQAGVDGDFKASNLMVNLIARYPEGKIRPYIGAGIGWSWGALEASGSVGGITGAVDESDNAFAWQILAGVNFEITPQWSADLGYRYFSSKYTFNIAGEDVDMTAKNHMILIGVNFHF